MNIRILNCGVIGGLLATYFLSFPLYLVLPKRYDSTWGSSDWDWTGPVGYLLAALVVVSAGYAAARWDWQTTRRGRADTGALAGMIAGMIAYALIGAASAAVASQKAAWLGGSQTPFFERDALMIVVDCVISSAWLPFLTFWGMFAGGSILGCLGGWIADIDPAASPWGSTPPRRATSSVFDSSVALMLMGCLILLVILAAITTLETNANASIAKYDLRPGAPTQGIMGCALGMTLVMLIVATAFCGQWCAGRWNHPLSGMRRTARLAAIMMVALPLLTLGLTALVVSPDIFSKGYFALGAAVWVGVMLFWLLVILLRPGPAAGAPPPTSPSFKDRLVLNAGFIGATYPALIFSTGVTQAVALALGIVPHISTVMPGQRPFTVVSAAVGAVGLAAAPATTPYGPITVLAEARLFGPTNPPQPPPNKHALLQDLYTIHVWGACGMVVFWFLATVIHAFIIQALPALWRARQAAAS